MTTPIVFTTSYDQYAIQAFEQNSISYLLKPVKKQDITKALSKYAELYGRKELLHDKVLTLHTGYQNKFMVEFGNTLRTFMSSDVAYFMLRNKRYLFIKTKDNNQFMYDSSLELLEKRVDPSRFFRINRQYIINKEIVKEVQYLSRGRLLLDTDPQSKEELVVSIGRAKTFKQWFAM